MNDKFEIRVSKTCVIRSQGGERYCIVSTKPVPSHREIPVACLRHLNLQLDLWDHIWSNEAQDGSKARKLIQRRVNRILQTHDPESPATFRFGKGRFEVTWVPRGKRKNDPGEFWNLINLPNAAAPDPSNGVLEQFEDLSEAAWAAVERTLLNSDLRCDYEQLNAKLYDLAKDLTAKFRRVPAADRRAA